jgi:asparagine synthase (glutamine-hydrolysing)
VLPTLVEHYGEPYADSSAIPTYYVSRETRRHVTVALNGDGGDESFAGYERYMAMELAEVYRRVPRALRSAFIEGPVNLMPTSELKKTRVRDVQRFFASANEGRNARYFRWMSTFKPAVKPALYTADFMTSLAGQDASHFLDKWFDRSNGSGVLDATLRTDQMTYLPNDLLVKVDIASMANSLERSPSRSSSHRVCREPARKPQDEKVSDKIAAQKGRSAPGASRGGLSPQDGLWRSRWPVVSG